MEAFSCSVPMGPKWNHRYLYRIKAGEALTHTREGGNVTMKASNEVAQPQGQPFIQGTQAATSHQPPEAGRGKE